MISRQERLLRIVRGAVKNAADAHPRWRIDPRFGYSVAKRAAGTLMAQWPEVLALVRASDRGDVPSTLGSVAPLSGQPTDSGKRGGKLHGLSASAREHRASENRRDALPRLRKQLTRLVGPAKWAEQNERAAALIDVLRLISVEIERSRRLPPN